MEIELLLKSFRFNLAKLMDLEDKLYIINDKLRLGEIKSPAIKSPEEALYQRGTLVYQNQASELMYEEEMLIKERDFYLHAVKKVETFLQRLTDEEIKLIELRYWHNFEVKHIARMYYSSKSAMYRKFDAIFLKLGTFPPKFVV